VGSQSTDRYYCNYTAARHSFELSDFDRLKRCDFYADNTDKIQRYIEHYYFKCGYSIRAITDAMRLKKSFVGVVVGRLTKPANKPNKLVTKILHHKIYFTNYASFLRVLGIEKFHKNNIDTQVDSLYSKGCSPQVIQYILNETHRLVIDLHEIRKIIKKYFVNKNSIDSGKYTYYLDSKKKIFTQCEWILNYLLTYKIRIKQIDWEDNFFDQPDKILEYIKEQNIYVTKRQLGNTLKKYALTRRVLNRLNQCIYEHQINFTYIFENGYKLTVYFEEDSSIPINLNVLCV
jgi:hypothetical protein